MKSGLLDCSNSQTKNLSYLAKNPDFHLSWQHNFLARFVKLNINDIRTNLRYNLCNQLVPELFDTADITCYHSAADDRVEVKYIFPIRVSGTILVHKLCLKPPPSYSSS